MTTKRESKKGPVVNGEVGGREVNQLLAIAAEAALVGDVDVQNDNEDSRWGFEKKSVLDMVDVDLRHMKDLLGHGIEKMLDNEEVRVWLKSLCSRKAGKSDDQQVLTGLRSLNYKLTGISPMILKSKAQAYARRNGTSLRPLGEPSNLVTPEGDDGWVSHAKLAFKAAVTQKAHGLYSSFDEDGLQPDWENINDYSEGRPFTKGWSLGRMYVGRKVKRVLKNNEEVVLELTPKGVRSKWVMDIRFSKEAKPVPFTQVRNLGIGMKVYDSPAVVEFVKKFYQEPERLIWRKDLESTNGRWSVWMPVFKHGIMTGWLWAPLSHKSSEHYEQRVNPQPRLPKQKRKVLVSPDGKVMMYAKRTGDGMLKVQMEKLTQVKETIRPKLQPYLTEVRGEDVFSDAVTEITNRWMAARSEYRSSYSWGDTIKRLLADGWKLSD